MLCLKIALFYLPPENMACGLEWDCPSAFHYPLQNMGKDQLSKTAVPEQKCQQQAKFSYDLSSWLGIKVTECQRWLKEGTENWEAGN